MVFGRDIIIRKRVKPATKLDNGDYIPGESCWDEALQCDSVPNEKALTVPFADGERKTYTYEITLDIATEPFSTGEQVMLLTNGQAPMQLVDANGNVMFDNNDMPILVRHAKEYTVLGYHRYSFIAKLWL